jgi:hypothetical protein
MSSYWGKAYGISYVEDYELELVNERFDYVKKYIDWRGKNKTLERK